MSTPDKLPEAQNALPSAAVAAPAETAVTPAAVREGEIRAVDQKLAALEKATQGTADDKQTALDQVAASTGTTTPSADTEDKVSGGWEALSGASGFFAKLSESFGELGKKFSEWLKKIMGTEGDNSEAPPSSSSVVQKAKDVVYRILDLLNPKAPYFTFLGGKSPRITSGYGNRDDPMNHGHAQNHKGIDITLAEGNQDVGEPVVATRVLKVAYTDTSSGGGNIVAVEDPANPGVVIPLLHLQSLNNRVKGDTIQPGEIIARIGNTGARSTGAHLHVEAKRNGQNIDPGPYLGLA